MKKAEFVELMTLIDSFYPGRFKNDEHTAKAWWEILKGHEFELCKSNLIKHVETSEWIPSIANLIAEEKDTSRTYSGSVIENINGVKPIEEYIKEIEKRTGWKVSE